VAFYIKSETDSYYFSLAIWNSITKEYPNMLWRMAEA